MNDLNDPTPPVGQINTELIDQLRKQLTNGLRQKKRQPKRATGQSTLLDQVEGMPVVVCEMTVEKLLEKAIDQHNQMKDGDASVSSDLSFLIRITQNYLRHECSNYDEVPFETGPDDPDSDKGYKLWKAKVQAAIDEAYPNLAEQISQVVGKSTSQAGNSKPIPVIRKYKPQASQDAS